MNWQPFRIQIQRFIRSFVLLSIVGMIIGLSLFSDRTTALAASSVTVYRDPSCSCCGGWIQYLSEQGFQTTEISTADIDTLKQQYGVPNALASCHTAVVDGYVLEGHVPVADIRHLLEERPPIAGIAVPGMPIGTPGMENGDQHDSFTVFSFDRQGRTEPFNQY